MRCLVFSTHRQIRDYIAARDDTLLPKLYTMEEFLRRVVVVPGKVFVDETERVLYLYRAIENLDISRLGFGAEFVEFVRNAPFVFGFFEELHAERVSIADLKRADLYADFEEHLAILEAIRNRYARLLESDGRTDRILIGDDFRLNGNFLKGFERIDIRVDGFLSRFELEVLGRIGRPLYLSFVTSPYNRRLTERLEAAKGLPAHREATLAWREGRIVEEKPLAPLDAGRVEVAAFSERIDQVAFAMAKVAEFVEAGADPSRVAVILPDEGFADYLRLFDTAKNFNYAMGIPFTQSRYYRRLADLYDALTGRSAAAMLKTEGSQIAEAFARVDGFGGFVRFLEELETTPAELGVIDPELFAFRRYADHLRTATPLQLLHAWLARLEPLSLDDVGGGKVTVMGVLESRGKAFDGVVIVDFNEELVPRVAGEDLFLNSLLRAEAGMPTRADKESLQKHYYYRLLQSAGRAAISYVRSEERLPSRFLEELGLGRGTPVDGRYRPLIAPRPETPRRWEGEIAVDNPFAEGGRITPTALKDLLECPRRWYYRYVLGIGKKEKGRNLGVLIHEALEAAARARERFQNPGDYFAFVMDRLYAGVDGVSERFDVALAWEERLRRFCEKDFEALVRRPHPVVEDWVEAPFGAFTLSAKIDRVDLEEGKVCPVDYKSSKSLKKSLKDPAQFQPVFYEIWAGHAYGDLEVEVRYWDLYEGKIVVPDTSGGRERLAEVLERLRDAERIECPMTEDLRSCRHCPYATACGRG